MNEKQVNAWRKARERGRGRYVLSVGVPYGTVMFLFMTFVLHRQEFSPRFVVLSAVLWSIGGALFGFAMWYIGEYRFRRALGNGVKK